MWGRKNDRVYFDIDESTEALIVGMFDQQVELKMFPSLQKQKGGVDCGVFCSVIRMYFGFT